ncbi:MAG TPA: aldo/keto reductase [Woeseiaceae bacterium]|nr:aldo/keto reductase [Woeseiaceae bacterium]
MANRIWNRRELLAAASALGLGPLAGLAGTRSMMTRTVPAAGNEAVPVIGLGTYEVFDVDGSPHELAERKDMLAMLTAAGGSVIDTSPMYRRSEKVIGELIAAGQDRDELFIATKVWTDGRQAGLKQMQRSANLMKVDVIDLMQVHNLRDTATHMQSISELQAEGRVRFSGLTHYRADALAALEAEMRQFKPQFIQINYSLGEREADKRVLPLAKDLGIGVLINRPYQSGALFRAVRGQDLPDWARGFADSWGQFFLKFIVSHPAVTCAIPATSKTTHMLDNLQAGTGVMPDESMRTRMLYYIQAL